MKADIVIIDSGLDESHLYDRCIKGGVTLKINKKGQIETENDYIDQIGHGTAVFDIIKKNCKESTFFIIKIFDNEFDIEQNILIYSLEYVYHNIECKFIAICSGTLNLQDVYSLKVITHRLYYDKKVIIVSAFSNEGAISYPAADENVVGVDSEILLDDVYDIFMVENSPINILGNQRTYRVEWINQKKIIDKGNSYFAAEICGKLCDRYIKTGCDNRESLIESIATKKISYTKFDFDCMLKSSFLCQKNKKLKAVVFPFSKEEHVLAANENLLEVEIVDYYDVRESGKVGLVIKDIIGFGDNSKIIKNIDKLENESEYDLIICGHIGTLSNLTKINWKLRIEDIARRKNKKIFGFDSFDNRNKDINFFYPPTIKKFKGNNMGKLWKVNSPVLGIFGTSSVQGKFSLQLKVREKLIERGYQVKQIATEPTGELFGIDYTCPIGYNSSFELSDSDGVKFYNQLIHQCDIKQPDIILVGGQSAILHHSLNNERFFCFEQYAFLLGTDPDAIVLVINLFDEISYIKRAINFIESVLDTCVIACVLSVVRQKEFLNMDMIYDKQRIDFLIGELNKPVFEFNVQIEELCSHIIDFFGGIE